VPTCAACDRYLTPSTVRPDGTCPECGQPVDPAALAPAEGEPEDEETSVPWHLKLFGGALALYLGYRCFQLIEWLAGKL
jgi:hypothetical protein